MATLMCDDLGLTLAAAGDSPIAVAQVLSEIRPAHDADPEAGDDLFTRLGRRLEIAAASLKTAEAFASVNNLDAISARLARLRTEVNALDSLIATTIDRVTTN